jgi:hypothetical protein
MVVAQSFGLLDGFFTTVVAVVAWFRKQAI